MVSEDRQRELESLLEKGVITDSAFDSIHALLPAESALSGPSPAAAASSASRNSTPAQSHTSNPHPAPPSYAQSTASPPSLPSRNNPAPPPPPDSKPVLAHARALYRYTASDARDCSFERDDRVAVHEYMNADWWMGRNLRTGQEGIFPRNYVVVEEQDKGPVAPVGYQQPQYAAQPAGYPGAGYPGAAGGGYPAAPPPGPAYQQQQQPEQEGGGSKMGEHGKKFGKKLGNAAIFGAGRRLGVIL
ncbi:hypothetical protein NEMBOFW57_001776 [Staphylotrichum longicolle]|uniref:SH3 domain-containing protein n=1 Tax=Staphylotrichum longicolle TaxID=669026 RepID=A0AAD4F2A3_9PEZI|nr:hypothetical protein NEMBOFW57_001776 [Staphylotrichum longicolle]